MSDKTKCPVYSLPGKGKFLTAICGWTQKYTVGIQLEASCASACGQQLLTASLASLLGCRVCIADYSCAQQVAAGHGFPLVGRLTVLTLLAVEGRNSSLSAIILPSLSLLDLSSFPVCRASLSLNFVVGWSHGLCTNVAPGGPFLN
eukprot:1159428-Pelagomonas_calceolata.AAC.1